MNSVVRIFLTLALTFPSVIFCQHISPLSLDYYSKTKTGRYLSATGSMLGGIAAGSGAAYALFKKGYSPTAAIAAFFTGLGTGITVAASRLSREELSFNTKFRQTLIDNLKEPQAKKYRDRDVQLSNNMDNLADRYGDLIRKCQHIIERSAFVGVKMSYQVCISPSGEISQMEESRLMREKMRKPCPISPSAALAIPLLHTQLTQLVKLVDSKASRQGLERKEEDMRTFFIEDLTIKQTIIPLINNIETSYKELKTLQLPRSIGLGGVWHAILLKAQNVANSDIVVYNHLRSTLKSLLKERSANHQKVSNFIDKVNEEPYNPETFNRFVVQESKGNLYLLVVDDHNNFYSRVGTACAKVRNFSCSYPIPIEDNALSEAKHKLEAAKQNDTARGCIKKLLLLAWTHDQNSLVCLLPIEILRNIFEYYDSEYLSTDLSRKNFSMFLADLPIYNLGIPQEPKYQVGGNPETCCILTGEAAKHIRAFLLEKRIMTFKRKDTKKQLSSLAQCSNGVHLLFYLGRLWDNWYDDQSMLKDGVEKILKVLEIDNALLECGTCLACTNSNFKFPLSNANLNIIRNYMKGYSSINNEIDNQLVYYDELD